MQSPAARLFVLHRFVLLLVPPTSSAGHYIVAHVCYDTTPQACWHQDQEKGMHWFLSYINGTL